ncbi:hypothetical protein [Nocardia sp. NPDC005366]|uniref:hypothetical protein n=1 Tax=Nocardia sp. NPDC005366 TaxID=3156878 RepID=UPI0033A013BE
MSAGSESRSAPDRLTVVDDIFLRTHRGLGTPIALQGLWRTADRVDRGLLDAVHMALRTGPLGRRVIRPAIPGARKRWQPTVRAYALDYDERPVPTGSLFDWADRQGYDLDPEIGPGWRLAATWLDDGGSLVSLTCSHALADGRALVIAADQAIRTALARPAVPIISDPAGSDSDWSDAGRQWSTVLRGTARALRGGIPRRTAAAPPREPTAPDTPNPVALTCCAVIQCPAADWDRVACSRGGTANSLFIWLVANILWASGFPGTTIEASLPVDTRDEPRVDNDLAMTQIRVTRDATPAIIREKSRAAYEYRMTAPAGMPEELLQVIPDRLAHRLSAGAGERDILCSNIGPLPESLHSLGPHHCTGVAARAIHPGLTADRLPRTRLSGYLCRIGGDYVLSLVSLDPARIPSAEVLRGLVETVCEPLPLSISTW